MTPHWNTSTHSKIGTQYEPTTLKHHILTLKHNCFIICVVKPWFRLSVPENSVSKKNVKAKHPDAPTGKNLESYRRQHLMRCERIASCFLRHIRCKLECKVYDKNPKKFCDGSLIHRRWPRNVDPHHVKMQPCKCSKRITTARRPRRVPPDAETEDFIPTLIFRNSYWRCDGYNSSDMSIVILGI